MGLTEPFPPICPITGLPASRRIQQVSGALLIALWQAAFGVSTARKNTDFSGAEIKGPAAPAQT